MPFAASVVIPNFRDAARYALQGCVAPAGGDELVVGAVFDKAAAVDGDDAVAAADGREPVRDDEHRSPAADLLHALLDDALALVIERARRLVENEDARIGDERARDRQPLLLAAREAAAALADDRVVAARRRAWPR